MATTFIYALCEPGTRTVRYIGKTGNLEKRFRAHVNDSSKNKNYLGNWLRSILLRGEVPSMITLREVPEAEGSAEEIHYIRVARMLNVRLTNATDGGEGLLNPTEDTRKRMSAAQIKIKAQKSLGMTGEKNPMFGKHHSAEASAKQSAAQTGQKRSPETCIKMRKPKSPAHCQNISKGRMGIEFTPEHCANLSAARKGKKLGRYKKRSGATSKFRGVSWHSTSGKWQGDSCSGGKTTYLGLFVSESDAAEAVRIYESK